MNNSIKDMLSGIDGSCTILEKDYTIHTSAIGKGDYNLLIAQYPFWCIRCGTLVKPGETYVENLGFKTCICIMPVRKLKATGVKRLKTF